MTIHEGLLELIAVAATADNVSPLETLFDVVAVMPMSDAAREELNSVLFHTIKAHPAY